MGLYERRSFLGDDELAPKAVGTEKRKYACIMKIYKVLYTKL